MIQVAKYKTRRALFLICALALLLNAILLFLCYWPASKILIGDEGAYLARASRIARGEVVRRTMLWPPGYDYFLALPIRMAMAIHFPVPRFIAQLLQIVLWCLAGAIFWQITAFITPRPEVRLIAQALFVLNPTLIAFSHYFWPEIPHLTLYLFALWLLMKHPVSLAWNGVLGAVLALATLFKLVYLPISITLLLLVPILHHYRGKRWFAGLIASLTFLIVLAPISFDNLKMHGTLMVGDSTLFNLWVGLNDRETTDWHPKSIVGREGVAYIRLAPSYELRNVTYWKQIRTLLAERGISKVVWGQLNKQYFRLFDHRTFFTKQLPEGMQPSYRFSSRLPSLFFRALNDFVWAFTLIGVGFGVAYCILLRQRWMLIPFGFVCYNLLLFFFLHVKTRYVIQFLPMLCLLAASGLIQVWTFILSFRNPVPSAVSKKQRSALIWGAVLSVMLLVIGFQDILLP